MSQDARRVDPTVVPGARPAPSPDSSNPAVRRCARRLLQAGAGFTRSSFDGYRAQAHLRNGQPAVYTRAGYGWTSRFQPISDALATLPAIDLILDAEAVMADSRGVPDFGLLQADLAARRQDRLLYYRQPGLPVPRNSSTRSLGKPRGFEVLAPSRPGTFGKPRSRLQRL
jgi:hypothetical protein